MTESRNPARRVVKAEGDGKAVYRVASKYTATAQISQAPSMAEEWGAPRVALSMDPDGTWRVVGRPAGAGGYEVLHATSATSDARPPRPGDTVEAFPYQDSDRNVVFVVKASDPDAKTVDDGAGTVVKWGDLRVIERAQPGTDTSGMDLARIRALAADMTELEDLRAFVDSLSGALHFERRMRTQERDAMSAAFGPYVPEPGDAVIAHLGRPVPYSGVVVAYDVETQRATVAADDGGHRAEHAADLTPARGTLRYLTRQMRAPYTQATDEQRKADRERAESAAKVAREEVARMYMVEAVRGLLRAFPDQGLGWFTYNADTNEEGVTETWVTGVFDGDGNRLFGDVGSDVTDALSAAAEWSPDFDAAENEIAAGDYF